MNFRMKHENRFSNFHIQYEFQTWIVRKNNSQLSYEVTSVVYLLINNSLPVNPTKYRAKYVILSSSIPRCGDVIEQ